MAGFDFTYTIGFLGNTKDLSEKIQVFSGNLKKNPLKLDLALPGMETGQAQKALDSIRAQATEILSVTANTQQMRTVAGQTYTELTGLTTRWVNAQNQVVTSFSPIQNNLKNLDGTIKSYDAIAKKAEDWGTRAEKMGKKEGEAIQNSSRKVLQLITDYKNLAQAGNLVDASKLKPAIQQANVELDKQISLSKRAANAVRGWADNLSNAIKQTISYSLSLGLVRQAQQLFNQAIKYTIELNKEMVNIQVLQAEGAQTDEEITSLAQSYNQLAKEMGATTVEIAKGSVEWLRQGKTIAQTTELLKASTMLGKLGALTTAQATEYLTATLNSYRLSAEKAVSVVDKLIAVDNASATSTYELSTALKYSAATAAESGVTLEQLISYIGVMSSVTRINAESIGQSLKTIFARMQDIKAGKIDEDGLGINNVESALARVDIKLRDSATSFRDFSMVLEDLSAKWSTLNDIEQANIAKAIAGIRQQNLFAVLMQNMGMALNLQNEQLNASGLALDRYQIYLNGVEAATNKFKATLEGLYQNAISSGFITSVIDAGTTIIKFIDDIGGLKTILIGLSGILAVVTANKVGLAIQAYISAKAIQAETASNLALAKAQLVAADTALIAAISRKNATMATIMARSETYRLAYDTYTLAASQASSTVTTNTFSAALKGLGITLSTTGAIALGAGVVLAGVALAIYLASTKAERLQKKFEKLAEVAVDASNAVKSTRDEIDTINELVNEYDELNDIKIKSAENTARMIEIEKSLADLIPLYDTKNSKLEDNKQIIADTVTLLQQQLDAETAIAEAKAGEAAIGADTSFKATQEKISDLTAQRDNIIKKRTIVEEGTSPLAGAYGMDLAVIELRYGSIDKRLAQLNSEIAEFNSKLTTGKKALIDYYSSLDTEEKWDFFKNLTPESQAIINQYFADLKKATEEALDVPNEIAPQASEAMEKYAQTLESLETASDGLTASMDALASAEKEQIKNGYISEETALSLMATNANLTQYLYQTADGFYLDADAAKAAILAEVQAILTNLQLGNAAQYAGNGQFYLAIRTIQASNAMVDFGDKAKYVIGLLQSLQKLSIAGISTPSGGGSSAANDATKKANDAAKKALEDKIKALEKQKDALKDNLEEFNKWIDAQKESLRLQKEEKEFSEEIAEKNKDLAKLKTEIALLSLDDSEEARAKRLELEEEASDLESEITKDTEGRKYDLQIDALDRAQQKFEDSINKQIDGIDKVIDRIREQISAISGVASTGASGGGTGSIASAWTDAEKIQTIVSKLMSDNIERMTNLTKAQVTQIQKQLTKMAEAGASASALAIKLDFLIRKYQLLNSLSEGKAFGKIGPGATSPTEYTPMEKHSGGMVEEHHSGNFAGNLKSNEVYAKLLKGEYVSTEGEMTNFLKNILPKFIGRMPVPMSRNTSESITFGDIRIEIHGVADKNVLAEIDKQLFATLNKAIRQKGKKPDAYNYSV